MALNRRRFLQWVERRMLSAGEMPASFALHHVGRNGAGSRLCSLSPLNASADEIATSLADQVQEESNDHAQGLQGRQQYTITAFDDRGGQVGEFAFSASPVGHRTDASSALVELTPEQMALSTGQAPEQLGHPTAMVAGQLMRHTEGLVRNLVEMSSVNRERDAQIIRQQQESIDKHEANQFKLLELMETMHSQQQERALKEKTYADDESRKERLFEQLHNLVLPALAERAQVALGGAAPKDGATTVGDVRSILLGLPDDAQNALVAALNDKDKATLMSIFEPTGDTKH